ncbi:hypothetical protein QE447_001183 [Stenotrophomonas sp. SORGH_AS282]|nr:hypothetical protein [Stenotrophomonas sp. SORGH_AS_0282]
MAGRRRSHRAHFAREHRLVALAVVQPRLALDVGRQWQPPRVEQPLFQRLGHVEPQHVELAIAAQHLGLAAGIERDPAAGLRRFAGAYLGPGLLPAQQAFNQDFHATAAGLLAEQAGRDHPGIVEDQQVAGLQQRRQVAHLAVFERGRRLRHHHQAAGRALGERGLGDQFSGKVVMEVGLLQGSARQRVDNVGHCTTGPRWQREKH